MKNAQDEHIASLHALRGIAALGVVILHLSESTPGLPIRNFTDIVANMLFAVDLFFVLSGVVMAAVYGAAFDECVRGSTYFRFLMARVARIWPMMILAATLAITAEWISNVAGTTVASTGGTFSSFLAEFFGLAGWFTWAWLNPPSWSLTAEFAVYLVAPLLILAFRRAPVPLCLATLAVAPLVPGILYGMATAPFVDNPLGLNLPFGYTLLAPEAQWFWNMKGGFILTRGLSMFLCGLALHRLARLGCLERLSTLTTFLGASAATLVALHAGLPRVLILFLLIALVATSLGRHMTNHAIFRHRTLHWLGEISLGVYLIHWPLIQVARASYSMAFGTMIEEAGPLECLLFILTVLLAVIAVASWLYGIYEIPARRIIRAWGERRLARTGKTTVFMTGGKKVETLVLSASAFVLLVSIPFGIITQGYWLREGWANQLPVITQIRKEANDVVLILDHQAPLPVRVAGWGDIDAVLGPHRRNALVLKPGLPLQVTLVPRPMSTGQGGVELFAGRIHEKIELK
ncbi:MAG: acyltransferase [Geminicoccaceae bacterium]|nr:acyltransferase [Geminicoccaceae bacterium]MCB9945332.1 acyltransferase [Geminicoccaceae bacterium]